MTNAEKERTTRSYPDFLAVFFSTCFFSSYIPVFMMSWLPLGSVRKYLEHHKRTGAGFMGSVCGLLTYLLLPMAVAHSIYGVLVGIAFSLFVGHRAEVLFGVKDDSRIVIDEWIGMWIAAWGMPQQIDVPILVCFGLFRFFDVVKGPWGRYFQKMRGGWGVIMDDVFAGILANLSMRLLQFLFSSALS